LLSKYCIDYDIASHGTGAIVQQNVEMTFYFTILEIIEEQTKGGCDVREQKPDYRPDIVNLIGIINSR
jgi:hypothetical protein